jgi:hypothetical protein
VRTSASSAASNWHAQGRPAGLLWRSPQLEQLRAFHQRRAEDMTLPQVEFLAASERQRKRERWRYAGTATLFLAVLSVALPSVRYSYIGWKETQPWARLINMSTGLSYPLRHDIANVGRSVEGAEDLKPQVDVQRRAVSRIHLSISKTGRAIDWRSPYGTSRNDEWLRYGEMHELEEGDILVLSGLEIFRYQPIEWSPRDYAREFLHRREFPDKTGLEAWAAVLDRKEVLPVRRDQQFVSLLGDRVELTDAKTEDSVLVVRRHIFHDRVTISPRDMQTFKLDGERDQPYLAYVIVPDKTWCPIKRDRTVLTLQRLPGSEKRMTSSIKEGDYLLRQIELPLGLEVAAVEGGGREHGLGEILFRTKSDRSKSCRCRPTSKNSARAERRHRQSMGRPRCSSAQQLTSMRVRRVRHFALPEQPHVRSTISRSARRARSHCLHPRPVPEAQDRHSPPFMLTEMLAPWLDKNGCYKLSSFLR